MWLHKQMLEYTHMFAQNSFSHAYLQRKCNKHLHIVLITKVEKVVVYGNDVLRKLAGGFRENWLSRNICYRLEYEAECKKN